MTRSRKFSLEALTAGIEKIARKRGAYAVFEKAVAAQTRSTMSALVNVLPMDSTSLGAPPGRGRTKGRGRKVPGRYFPPGEHR